MGRNSPQTNSLRTGNELLPALGKFGSIQRMTAHSLRRGAGLMLSALGISACASGPPQQGPITVTRVAEIQAMKVPPHMLVKTTIRLHEKDEVMTAPSVIQKPGQTASVDLVRDFRYPTDFTLPMASRDLLGHPTPEAAGKKQGAFPVTPTTPKEFVNQPTGIQMTLSPRFESGLVILKGEIKVTTFDGFTSAAGELVARPIIASKKQPILLTANKVQAPLIRENRSPIFVAALPGKTYTMQVAGAHGPMQVDFTCELVPDGKR